MSSVTRRNVLTGAASLAAVGIAKPARAQPKYPTQPIHVVVPFPAGGTTDIVARIFGERMSQILGQPVIVENRGGGGGSIGSSVVARAEPDGHTLLFHNITFSTTAVFSEHEGRPLYNIEKDFRPVSVAVNVPFLLLSHPSVPVKNLKELVDYARNRAKPNDPLLYGSTGPGSIMNLIGEFLKSEAKIEMTHVPFRGAAPMILELEVGRLHFGGDQLSTALERTRAGNLTGLAILSGTRSKAVPNVPTVGEMGFAGLNLRGFNGFVAPIGTPREIVERIQAATAEAARDPQVIERMTKIGAEPWGSTPEEFDGLLKEQLGQMRQIIGKLNIRTTK